MTILQNEDIMLLMVISVFFLGMCTFLIGIFVLIGRALGKDVRNLTAQTAQLAQKGIAEDVSGLVGNASALLEALQSMMKTTAGIGIFLTLVGIGLMGFGFWLANQSHWLV